MKNNLGPVNCLYPMPVTLVGANIGDRPNYLPIAHVGILNFATPQYISIGLGKSHRTNEGIREHGTFSVNIPSQDQVVETDYAGIVSAKNTDKSKLFETFYGELRTAPMVSECPVNMECRLYRTVDFPTHEVFIGEIVASYCDDEVMADGAVDLSRVRPMLFDMSSKHYWRLGEPFAKCWNIGKQLKK
jgi:flavin reductase (DIM6/NTAB) family NADH-FMN oxidoreductase RutF